MNKYIKVFIILLFLFFLMSYININTTKKHSSLHIEKNQDKVEIKNNIKYTGYFNYLSLVKTSRTTKTDDLSFALYDYNIIISDNPLDNIEFQIESTKSLKKLDYVKYVRYTPLIDNEKVKVNKNKDNIIINKDDSSLNIVYINNSTGKKEYDNFVLYSEEDKNYNFLDDYISKNYKKVFGEEVKSKVPIFMVDTSTDFSSVHEYGSEFTGLYKTGFIFVKDRDIKLNRHVLAHEVAHYYTDETFQEYPDNWLSEGIAEYLSGIYSNSYDSGLLDIDSCLQNKCYDQYSFINEKEYNKISQNITNSKFEDNPVWSNNNLPSSYTYSELIVISHLRENNKYYLEKEIEAINNGVSPQVIFDVDPCSDKEDKTECIEEIRNYLSS